MDFHHLKVFLAAARHLNYTHAGEELRLRQPTISAHIKQLETELGVSLFEQIGKRLILTEAGRLIEPIARRAQLSLAEVQTAIDEYRALGRGSLHLGASTTAGIYILPKLLTHFRALYPNIELRTSLANTSQVERLILDGEVDFGFVGSHPLSTHLVSEPWLSDQIILIVSPQHRFAGQRSIELKQLLSDILIQREKGSATRVLIEKELSVSASRFARVIELGHPEAIKEAVSNGLGIAFISRFAVAREIRSGDLVCILVKKWSLSRRLQICYREEKHLSKADTTLVAEAHRLEM
jgi:LysR family transcriptional regulator, low CO2-responsive transcriptional regulator